MISRYIDDDHGINALLQTCKRLFLLLNASLYKHNVKCSCATALEWAAEHGIEATARHALEAGISSDAMYYEGLVPMALACINGHEVIVRLLLDHGFDPDPAVVPRSIKGPEGARVGLEVCEKPMVLAASRGHEPIVKLLLTYGVAVDTPASDGATPLMGAAAAGHLSVAKILISFGSDLNHRNRWNHTAGSYAVEAGHVNMVRYLLEAGMDLEAAVGEHKSRLHLATRLYCLTTDMVTFLLEYEAKPGPKVGNLRALALAAYCENDAAAKIIRDSMDIADIISSGVSTDDNHKLLLLVSAACGWEELVLQLLEQGCSPDVSSKSMSPSMFAPDLPTRNRTAVPQFPSALTLAARGGHLGVVQILLRYNANLHDVSGIQKTSPLWEAILSNHRHVVQALLDHGANPNYRHPNGDSALFMAVDTNPEIFQLLLDHGADSDLAANHPWDMTLLAKALSSGSIESVEALRPGISFGQPWLVDNIPYEALFEAALRGGKAMVEYLLDRGYVFKPGSHAVKNALLTAVRWAAAPGVSLLFERGLVGTLLPSFDANLFGLVGSDLGMLWFGACQWRIATTMDQLLVHNVDIEAVESPFFSFVDEKVEDHPHLREYYFKQLLSRGADPLREDGNETPLSYAANQGWRKIVKMMLNALDDRIVPLDEQQRKIEQAANEAAEHDHMDIVRLLHRAYWRKKNKETSAP